MLEVSSFKVEVSTQAPSPSPGGGASCFVESTMVATTWGRCRIGDLARLSARYDEATAMWDELIANADDQDVDALQIKKAQDLDGRLPLALVRDPATNEIVQRAIVKVWQVGTATELVDVVIADDGQTVRVTPDHLFSTTNGDIAAADLEGEEVYRFEVDAPLATPYEIMQVDPVSLPDAVKVYDVEIEGIPSFSVAVDGTGPAVCVHNSKYRAPAFPDTGTRTYSEFIHKSRYARWLDDEGRRETWTETVGRYFAFFDDKLENDLKATAYRKVHDSLARVQEAVLHLDVMPSMRALWSAGPALKRCNVAGYNCAYCAVDHPRVFDEAVYILMSGCGLGFSVERQYVNKLPTVAESFEESDTTIVVTDSRTGWARAFRELISLLYAGQVPQWDLTRLRPAGARLRTSGGRSSGPIPLEELFRFTVSLFRGAAGRKLSSIECHDLMCFIGRIVVAGGVRRSAEISLSNPSDDRLRLAKSGQWWHENPQRALANNTAVYTERPDFQVFMREWWALYESKSGERGIYNRIAAQHKAESIGRESTDFGTNPCAEIALRSAQFCNLTEVVVRPADTLSTLKKKVQCAAILGTLQSDLLDLKYLRKRWQTNCDEERLLGVSLTGITDHPILGDPDSPEVVEWLRTLREEARTTNVLWAERLSIPASKAVTTVKPSGTVSQLVNSSSGIHPRYSRYYIRRVRADNKDPLARLMQEAGFPHEVDCITPTNVVFSFPIAAPSTARFADETSALTQAKLWKLYADHWADHSVSCTVYYSDHEFLGLGQWVWENFDSITGLSFLPRSDHSYAQAPYEAIREDEYKKLLAEMPKMIDWTELAQYERDDHTQGQRALACSGDVCELVDLTG